MKRDGFKNPNEGILDFSGAADRCKEDRITEDKAKTLTGEDSKMESVFAYGKPGESEYPWSWCKTSLKKKESKEEDYPNAKVTEKLSEGKP